MIVTISGVTGSGKSHHKNFLIDKMNLENMVIYTTREKRQGEVNGIDKNFVKEQDFAKLVNEGKIFAYYEFLGEKYGYNKKYLDESINSVTELHYEWIKDFKQKAKNVYSIYIIPESIERAKQELTKRNLPSEVEKKRIKEIEEHILRIKNDKELQNQFDFILYNDYTEKSSMKLVSIGMEILDRLH